MEGGGVEVCDFGGVVLNLCGMRLVCGGGGGGDRVGGIGGKSGCVGWFVGCVVGHRSGEGVVEHGVKGNLGGVQVGL